MRCITTLALGSALLWSACGSEGGSMPDAGTGVPPTITMIAWETTPTCTALTDTDYTVTVTVSDPDTDPGDLTFSGSVGGCDGALDAATSTITCPNVAPYPGTVMVTDGDGNESAPVAFTIGVCESSECTTDPSTCG